MSIRHGVCFQELFTFTYTPLLGSLVRIVAQPRRTQRLLHAVQSDVFVMGNAGMISLFQPSSSHSETGQKLWVPERFQ